MIYWHVERHSTCIYSQLKTPSSSEVAAMIEGVLRHCTEMEVQKAYVDSHGQSDVAFAFCHLLGFHLLPRLKPRSFRFSTSMQRVRSSFSSSRVSSWIVLLGRFHLDRTEPPRVCRGTA